MLQGRDGRFPIFQPVQFHEIGKEYILKTIEEQDKLTGELKRKIQECLDPVMLEDIYLPYKPKRKTRATIAHEKGLEPLAKIVMKQQEMQLGIYVVWAFHSLQTSEVRSTGVYLRDAIELLREANE